MILISGMRRALLAAATLGLVVFAGCGERDSGSGGPTVVASTTQVADIAANIAGERVELVGILPPGADPHDYEPKPSDVGALAESDLIIRSGGDLDAWLDEVIASSGTEGPVIELLDRVETLEGGHSHDGEHEEEDHAESDSADDKGIDPHWWHNPINGAVAAHAIADGLAEANPERAQVYEANAKDYAARLRGLDRRIADCIGRVPDEDREIVTSHDSLGYLADRYDIRIVGAALPALTTQAEPSAGEVAALVQEIRDEDVQAVFGETGLNGDLIGSIAKDAGAEFAGDLYADSLAKSGEGSTYLGALEANARVIAAGMSGGDPAGC